MIQAHWLFVFSVTYHNAIDILFLLFAALSSRIVRGTRWQAHLRWLLPFVANDALIVFNRVLLDGVELGIIHQDPVEHALMDIIGYLAEGVGAYGMYRLWQTLRDMAAKRSQTASVAPVHEENVWPPPPTSAI